MKKKKEMEKGVKIFASGAKRKELETRFDLICPIGTRKLADICAEGAKVYGDFNWTKGIPRQNIINHLENHLNLYKLGNRSEDHAAKIAWAAFALVHFDNDCRCGEGIDNLVIQGLINKVIKK